MIVTATAHSNHGELAILPRVFDSSRLSSLVKLAL